MNQMKALGLLSQNYASTDDFVDELTKHLKVSKICKKGKIGECWPTKTVATADDPGFDVNSVKTSKNLSMDYDEETDAVGLVLSDGAHIVLTYNTHAKPILETDATMPFGDSTNSTQSIAFVMDVNGGRGPNTENATKDIRGFRGAKFAKGSNCTGTEFEMGGTTVCYLGKTYDTINCTSSNSSSPDYKYCKPTPSGKSTDYWAGAKKACEDMGMQLPSASVLSNLYSYKDDAKSAGVTLSDWFWSSSEVSTYGYAYGSDFYDGRDYSYSKGGYDNTDRESSNYYGHGLVLCVGS